MPRFVILYHRPGPNSQRPLHWDLMFECGDALRTFASLDEPTVGRSLNVEPLDDHRLDYLDFQGPVSGGRGDVKQWDGGEFDVVEEDPNHWLLDVRGRKWHGRARFTAVAGQRWTVACGKPKSA